MLILGAGGRFGGAATAAFAAAGWDVLAQVRRVPTELPPGARHLATDLADSAALAQAAAGASVLVYAVNPPYTAWRTQLLPLARLGLDLAERLGAVFMLPGNVYGYGRQMPAQLRDDTPMAPDTVKGRLRVALEAELADRAARGLRSVVIRAGDFYGHGHGSWLDLAVVKSLAAGRLVYPGPLHVAHAWAYLPDLARAFVAVAQAADRGVPGCRVLHFAGHTLTGAQFLDGVERAARQLGLAPADRPLARRGMPWPIIRAGGWVVPIWREIAAMAYLWQVPHALDDTRLQQAVGPLPATPVDAAMVAALRALGFGRPATAGTAAGAA